MNDILVSLTADLESRLAKIGPNSRARLLLDADLESVITMASSHVTFGIMSKSTFVNIVTKIGREIMVGLGHTYDVRAGIQLGSFVLESFVHCGLVCEELRQDDSDVHHKYYVVPDDRSQLSALLELVKPEGNDHFPALEPVGDWTSGYHDNGLFLVRNAPQSVLRAISSDQHQTILAAVNKLQRSAWMINDDVCAVFERLMDDKRGHGKVLPHQDTTKAASVRSSYKVEAEIISKAAAYIGDRPFYHQYNVDFRGRIYPCTAFLNEQSSDRSKGMLQFAEAKPLGFAGYGWLLVYAANNWGNDKISIEDRQMFAEFQMDEWLSYAYDPFTNTGWMDADKPWCFLACCFEFQALREYCSEHECDYADYPCNLPVFIDGSNNGVQHMSALSHDETTAPLVNVTPTDLPGDVYMHICASVYAQIEADYDPSLDAEFEAFYARSLQLDADIESAAKADRSRLVKLANRYRRFCKARRFAPNYFMAITDAKTRRKLVKRPVMTLGYGGTRNGFKDMVLEDTKQMGPWFRGMNHGWAQYFADLVYFKSRGGKGHKAELPGLASMLTLFETLAGRAVDNGKALSWSVPLTNFPVVQQYLKPQKLTVKVQFMGRRIDLIAQNFQVNTINRAKQRTSASPNVVHSFDAAHLQLTTTACDFQVATVHDSFGCLPSDMDDLYRIVREQFVRFYSADPLTNLLAQHDSLDLMPVRGDLDVSEILHSDYAFV